MKQHKQVEGKTVALIVIGIFSALLIGIPIVVGTATAPKYVQGNYPDKSCQIRFCENPATWKITWNSIAYYYCDEHEEDGREHYNSLRSHSGSSSSQNTVKCKSCGRSFKKGSENAKNITQTNMCLNCYNNFNSMQGAINERPVN